MSRVRVPLLAPIIPLCRVSVADHLSLLATVPPSGRTPSHGYRTTGLDLRRDDPAGATGGHFAARDVNRWDAPARSHGRGGRCLADNRGGRGVGGNGGQR